jgi:epoxide hydrolase 4
MSSTDQQRSATVDVATTAWRHEFVETNQIRLHCVTQGQGELVILLHGFLEFWYSWRYQLPRLAEHCRVVVPDLRGYNDSDKPLGGYDWETLSQDISGLIRSLGYERATIVGHGWGGALAWQVAERFPAQVKSLVLMSAPHPHRFAGDLMGNVEQLRNSWYLLAAQIPGLSELSRNQDLSGLVRSLFQTYAVRKSSFSAEDVAIYSAALSKPGALRSVLNHSRQWLSAGLPLGLPGGLRLRLGELSLPILVLWGRDDSLFNYGLAESLKAQVRGPFQLVPIADCGHWVQQEAPQTVNRELIQFLRKYQG